VSASHRGERGELHRANKYREHVSDQPSPAQHEQRAEADLPGVRLPPFAGPAAAGSPDANQQPSLRCDARQPA